MGANTHSLLHPQPAVAYRGCRSALLPRQQQPGGQAAQAPSGMLRVLAALSAAVLPVVATAVPGARLSPTRPVAWKATYAAADPVAAQRFAVDYLGGRAIPGGPAGGDGTCAVIKWVVFDDSAPTCPASDGACSEGWMMHFVDLFSHRVGDFTLRDWRDYMMALNGNISYTGVHKYLHTNQSINSVAFFGPFCDQDINVLCRYNQYMDNHLGIIIDDAVPYLEKIRRDKIPYYTRRQTLKDTGCDIFLQIPNNGIIVELRSEHCPADIEEQNWDLCHYTNGTANSMYTRHPPHHNVLPRDTPAERSLVIPAPAPPPVAPTASVTQAAAADAGVNVTMRIWKMTYASSNPDVAANFTVDVLGATHIQHSGTLSDACGTVRWVEFGKGGFQAHFVHNPRKANTAPGKTKMSVVDLERYLTEEHGDISRANGTEGNAFYDQYMDNHIGLLVISQLPEFSIESTTKMWNRP